MTVPTTQHGTTERNQRRRSPGIVMLAALLLLAGGYGVWHYYADGKAKAAEAAKVLQR